MQSLSSKKNFPLVEMSAARLRALTQSYNWGDFRIGAVEMSAARLRALTLEDF